MCRRTAASIDGCALKSSRIASSPSRPRRTSTASMAASRSFLAQVFSRRLQAARDSFPPDAARAATSPSASRSRADSARFSVRAVPSSCGAIRSISAALAPTCAPGLEPPDGAAARNMAARNTAARNTATTKTPRPAKHEGTHSSRTLSRTSLPPAGSGRRPGTGRGGCKRHRSGPPDRRSWHPPRRRRAARAHL